jgi:hypothetical protein
MTSLRDLTSDATLGPRETLADGTEVATLTSMTDGSISWVRIRIMRGRYGPVHVPIAIGQTRESVIAAVQ